MKHLITLLLTLSTSVYATKFEIIDSCSNAPVFEVSIEDTHNTVGELTLDTFRKYNIQNKSSEIGVSQILSSPTGLEAMEVLSDTVMRSHGWCYSVDGQIPEVLMNEVYLTGNEKVISWFMGYSTYIGDPETGESIWEGQCVPSNSLEQKPFPELCD